MFKMQMSLFYCRIIDWLISNLNGIPIVTSKKFLFHNFASANLSVTTKFNIAFQCHKHRWTAACNPFAVLLLSKASLKSKSCFPRHPSSLLHFQAHTERASEAM